MERDQRGDAGADVLPHDDGDGHAVGDGAGHGQRLQNAHRGGGGLDDAGKDGAYQHPQQGVGKGSHETGKFRHIRQRCSRRRFISSMPYIRMEKPIITLPTSRRLLLFGTHDQQDARQRQQGREVFGLQEIDEEHSRFQCR